MTVIIVYVLFLVLVDMLFMYLACPGTTSFPAICGAAFQLLVPTKNKIAVVFVWVGLNSDKVRPMKSSGSELGLKNKI